MADVTSREESLPGAAVVLTLRYGKVVEASALGGLFSALATDYHQSTKGRILVVTSLQSGSLIAILQDAIAVAGNALNNAIELANVARDIKKFVGIVRELIGRAKNEPRSSKLFKRKRQPGIKSAEALLKIAINSQCEVEMDHTTSKGERIYFKVTPVEAIHIRDTINGVQPEQTPSVLPTSDLPAIYDMSGSSLIPEDIAQIITRMASAGQSVPVTSNETTTTAIAAIVRALKKSGMGFVLGIVAADLESRGHRHLAAIVRNESSRMP